MRGRLSPTTATTPKRRRSSPRPARVPRRCSRARYGGGRGRPGSRSRQFRRRPPSRRRAPLRSRAVRARGRRVSPGAVHAPDMAAVEVVLVRGVDNFAAVLRVGDVLHFELAGRKQDRGATLRYDGVEVRHTLGGDGVEVRPAVALPREDDAVAGGPGQLAIGQHRAKTTAPSRRGHPDLAPGAVRDAADADRPWTPRAPPPAPATTNPAAGHA